MYKTTDDVHSAQYILTGLAVMRKIVTSAFMVMLLYMPALAGGSNTDGLNINSLAWEIIAEKFNAKESFCAAKSKDANSINYALDPSVSTIVLPLNVKLPEDKAKAKLGLSKWQEGQWVGQPPLTVQIDSNSLTVDIHTIAEGFYELSFISEKNNIGKENKNFYAVIAGDWKKDLLAWCRRNKEQIETHPDSQLIYSSIVVSHLDNVQELASNSSNLSENILLALSRAIKAKAEFENGNCPDLVIGLNKIRFKRFEGSLVEEFVVFVPETYNKSNPEAVFLNTDNLRWAAKNNYTAQSGLIDLWWHTIDNKDINWKNFEYFFAILKQKLSIDENRVYVNGDCGNGLAAMSLALNFPDQWAECDVLLGNTYRHMAGNALNLPMIFVKGHHPQDDLIAYYNFTVECFKYYGCRLFKHSRNKSIADIRDKSVPDVTRNISPDRVFYTIESLANPSSYWIQIDGREDENFIASIDAIVWGQKILVKTNNIDAYTLNLKLAPLDCTRPVEIIENDKFLENIVGPVFVRTCPKYENVAYIKNKSLDGPVSDVFTDRYAVVWKGDDNIKSFARQLAGSGPCLEDVNVPAELIKTHNIAFVGRLDKSDHFAPIAAKFPVLTEDGRLTANNKVYEGDYGVFCIYPNPLNPQKYLVNISGTTDKAIGLLNNAWQQIKPIDNVDVGIFNVSENNKIGWLICEKFNTVWNWHKSWDTPLVHLEKKYPKWKWHQWVAGVLRDELRADITILEDTFISAQLPDTGELTLRDLSRIMKNDWIVKISLKGSDLRKLLRVFDDISSSEVSVPVIDGASLVKQPADSNVIWINELENDRIYTMALPYKAVNGRPGLVIENYRIEGEGFLVVLLREYLEKNTKTNLDAELDSIQINVF